MAGKLLNFIETDVGRPFSDIASTLEVHDWDALFAEVTREGHPLEREVKDASGRWHSLRIRPYRTSDNKIDSGLILVLFDTDVINRELEESRDYAHVLLESAEQAIVAANAEGKIVLVNGAAEKMFGYRRAEVLGENRSIPLLPRRHPSAQSGARRTSPGLGRRGNRVQRGLAGSLKGAAVTAQASPLEISFNTIDQAGVKLTVAFMTDITERQRLEKLSETYRGEVRALAAQLITAQEEERRRVSRELHDSLCQQPISLALEVESLAVELPNPVTTRARLRALGERAIKVSEEARHIAYELHPSVLDDLGIVVSLQGLCDEFSKTEKIRVKFAPGKPAGSGSPRRWLPACTVSRRSVCRTSQNTRRPSASPSQWPRERTAPHRGFGVVGRGRWHWIRAPGRERQRRAWSGQHGRARANPRRNPVG